MNPLLRISSFAFLLAAASVITVSTAVTTGCVVNEDDDDDDGDDDDNDDDDNDDDNDDDDNDNNGDVDPVEGSWTYSSYEIVRNDCNVNDNQLPGVDSGGFLLDNTSPASFTITPGDGGDPFNCSLTGRTFSCPDRASGEQTLSPFDATLSGTMDAAGMFINDGTADGTQVGTVSCTGAECPLVEAQVGTTFPCEFEVAFIADAVLGS